MPMNIKIIFIAPIIFMLVIFYTTKTYAYDQNLSCGNLSAQENDGELGRKNAINLIGNAYAQGVKENDFEKLNFIIHSWSSLDCKLTDGRSKLGFISYGMDAALSQTNNWNSSLEEINNLKKLEPDEGYPALFESNYWIKYAWDARGSGFASTVSPDGWKLFNERLKIAEKVLIDSKSISSNIPAWYDQMVIVKNALGYKEDRDKIFLDGAKRYKHYLPLFISMRNFKEPKWGGSWKDVDDFINWASNNADPSMQKFMYGRLYYGVRDNMLKGSFFFKDTLADWEKLRPVFEALVKQYPDSITYLGILADFSCEVDDKDTYLGIRKEIGDKIYEIPWGRHNPPDICDMKFGLPLNIPKYP